MHYIPTDCDEKELKDQFVAMFDGKLKQENIHVVKKFDEFVATYLDISESAKVVRDLRTNKYRKILKEDQNCTADQA